MKKIWIINLLIIVVVVALGFLLLHVGFVTRHASAEAILQCPRAWTPLLRGDGVVVGMVCYKDDGSRRIVMFQ